MTDRFSSREDAPEWDEQAFALGVAARKEHGPRPPHNPYVLEHEVLARLHLQRSWVAGWTDQDATEASR